MIGAAVLTYHGREQLRTCIAGLTRQSEWPFPVLIVDNDPSTGEGRAVAAETGEPVSCIEMPVNGGVPAGYNAGLAWAASAGLTHVLLLNHDVELVDPFLIRTLAAATDGQTAAVGPIVLDADGSVFSAGGMVGTLSGRPAHRRRPFAANRYEADWLDGSCLLVSVAAAQRVGGFEPRYFMYWEEVDWCVRARRAGFRLVVAPRTRLVHHRGSSAMTAFVRRQLRRNALLFQRRNLAGVRRLTGLIDYVTIGAARDLARAVRARTGVREEITTRTTAVSFHLKDALRGGWGLPATGPPISVVGRHGDDREIGALG